MNLWLKMKVSFHIKFQRHARRNGCGLGLFLFPGEFAYGRTQTKGLASVARFSIGAKSEQPVLKEQVLAATSVQLTSSLWECNRSFKGRLAEIEITHRLIGWQ